MAIPHQPYAPHDRNFETIAQSPRPSLVGELSLLQLRPETLAKLEIVVAPCHAEYLDLSVIRLGQTLEDFDCSRLSGTVRAKQPKTFTPVHLEV
jgi:hypothetical protein